MSQALAFDAPESEPSPRRADPRVLNRAALGLGRRSRTLSPTKLRRQRRAGMPPVVAALAETQALDLVPDIELDPVIERPRTRGDCIDGPRPCPWVACKHHLFLDVSPRDGAIKFNFPDLEPWELRETCALDVAGTPEDPRPRHLVTVGRLINVTRERIRQIERKAFRRAREDATGAISAASDLLEDGDPVEDDLR